MMRKARLSSPRKLRLLPPELSLGWAPFAWLSYLGFFLAYPVVHRASLGQWLVTLAGIAVFLVLYFRAFWSPPGELMMIIGAITAIGVVYAPFNGGASAFFIYAAAFACETGPPRRAVTVIGSVVAVCLAEAWLLDLPPWFWIPGAGISVVVGGVNIHWVEQRRHGARLRKVQDEMAAVAERDRIASELHDLLGHNLSMIILKAELASKIVGTDPIRARDEIADVERVSRETLSRVREAVRGYRSQGVQSEVELVRSSLAEAGIDTSVEIDPVRLDGTCETVAALFLREAGTNIIRHSGARRAWIAIAERPEHVELRVRDDGKGGAHRAGFGLSAMRARIEAVGGLLEIDGSEGTALAVRLPLRKEVS